MTFRRGAGLVLAVSLGIALGYAARSEAQLEPLTFRVEPTDDRNVIRLYVSRGGVEFVEDHAFEVEVRPEAAVVKGSTFPTIKPRGGLLASVTERTDEKGTVSKSFRIPTR
jgi:hypothetical protein